LTQVPQDINLSGS